MSYASISLVWKSIIGDKYNLPYWVTKTEISVPAFSYGFVVLKFLSKIFGAIRDKEVEFLLYRLEETEEV